MKTYTYHRLPNGRIDLDRLEQDAIDASRRRPFKDKDGITGSLKRSGDRILFEANRTGKATEAYQTIKRRLRDDWYTELDPDNWSDYLGRALRMKLT